MEHEYDELHNLMAKHNLLSLFEHLSFKEKVAKVMAGLKADKDSGEYKYARLQVQRLSAPASAILVPILGIGLLSLLAGRCFPGQLSVLGDFGVEFRFVL
jgi:hypothetical protein